MRYMVEIPKPSAKRLEANRQLIIQIHAGWSTFERTCPIPVGADVFDFEFDGALEHHDPNVLDGDFSTKFYIEYQNSTGTRVERAAVEPLPV